MVIDGSIKVVDLANMGLIRDAGAAGGSAGGVFGDDFTPSAINTWEHKHSHGSHQLSGRVKVNYGVGGGTMTGHEHFSRYGAGAYDGVALSEGVLEEYYSAVSILDHDLLKTTKSVYALVLRLY